MYRTSLPRVIGYAILKRMKKIKYYFISLSNQTKYTLYNLKINLLLDCKEISFSIISSNDEELIYYALVLASLYTDE